MTYNCPAKRPTHRSGEQLYVFHEADCPKREQCDPASKMGPLVHTRPGDNPRVNLPIPRGGQTFERLYRGRTGVERFFSVLKVRGKMGQRPYRRRFVYQMMATVHAIGVHARAWVEERFGQVPTVFDALWRVLAELRGEREEVAAAA